jgi:hypothetical protein
MEHSQGGTPQMTASGALAYVFVDPVLVACMHPLAVEMPTPE